jgi:Domain of unknown function (DUF4340)
MEMNAKLGIAVGALVVLGGVLWMQQKKEKEEAKSYTAESRSADLPKIELGDEQTKGIDKITVEKGKEADAGKAASVTLEKKGDDWKLTAPLAADANQTNVTSLLTNLKQLKVSEAIDPSAAGYEKFGLTDAKSTHVTFQKGKDAVLELWLGESGSRGQMARIGGHDGVYALKGFSSFLYEREVKDWRDRAVFKFDDTKVKNVEIENEHGKFVFAKDKDQWTAKFKKAKEPMAKAIVRFDDAKLKDAMRAYKGLNADNFGDDKKVADVGLEKPMATISFTLDDGGKKTLHLGSNAEGSSRWAEVEGGSEILSIGSWAADWAMADVAKFQKPEGKDGGADAKGPSPMTPPMGMGMPPGMGAPPDMGGE